MNCQFTLVNHCFTVIHQFTLVNYQFYTCKLPHYCNPSVYTCKPLHYCNPLVYTCKLPLYCNPASFTLVNPLLYTCKPLHYCNPLVYTCKTATSTVNPLFERPLAEDSNFSGLLKVNEVFFQYSDGDQRKGLPMAPLLPHDITSMPRGVVYFQLAMLSALLIYL